MRKSTSLMPSKVRAGIKVALDELLRLRPDEEFNVLCEMLDLDAKFDGVKAGKLSRICTTVACEGDLAESERSIVTRAATYAWLREQMSFLD